ALENARLFEETQRRESEAKTLSDGLTLLNQAARALHRTLEVDAMLDGALTELARSFAANGALVHLLNEDGSLSRSVGHWVSGGPHPGDPGRLGGIRDHVRRTRAPLLLRDVTRHPEFVHPANVAHGVRSIAAFPIVGQRERVLGVLVLYYTTAQALGDTETRLLTSYADQLATALENVGLYEETQTQRVRLGQDHRVHADAERRDARASSEPDEDRLRLLRHPPAPHAPGGHQVDAGARGADAAGPRGSRKLHRGRPRRRRAADRSRERPARR